MKVKQLYNSEFRIVATMNGQTCPAFDFLIDGEASTKAAREGLQQMLGHIADKGLSAVPSAWSHEVNKQNGIFEFIKGPLRLFYFKGENGDIAICTSGVRKSGAKADKPAVNAAIRLRNEYKASVKAGTYEVIDDENE